MDIARNILPARAKLYLRELGAAVHDIPCSEIAVADGRKFRVRPNRSYWDIYYRGAHEEDNTVAVRKLLRPGDVTFDVGANIGWYTTLFAAEVGPRGEVHAFEPIPATAAEAETNIKLNGQEQVVKLNRTAVADFEGQTSMYVNTLTPGLASMGAMNWQGGTVNKVEVDVITLDKYCREKGIESAAVLKCDIEGAELSALSGAAILLSRDDGPIIMSEINRHALRAFGTSPSGLVDLLVSFGYDRFYRVHGTNRVRALRGDSDLSTATTLLAAKGDRAERRWLERGIVVR